MRLGSVAIFVAAVALLWGAPAASATIAVNTTKDEMVSGDGKCSLREAVSAVDGSPSPDCPGGSAPAVTTIALAPGTFHLSLGTELTLTRPVAIQGAADPSQTVIDGDRHDRVLLMQSTQASIANVTVTGGRSRDGSDGSNGTSTSHAGQTAGSSNLGGGIYNSGTLTISNSVITGDATGNGGNGGQGFAGTSCGVGGAGGNAGGGGGIFSSGTLTLSRVSLTANSTGDGGAGGQGGSNTGAGSGCAAGQSGLGGNGAGVLNQGSLTIIRSTIANNRTGNGGPGGTGGSGTIATAASVGSAGGKGGSGAGVADQSPPLTITTSTIAGNQTGNGGRGGLGGSGINGAAGGDGGLGGFGAGIWTDASGTSSVSDSTLTLNTAGDGGYGGSGGFGGAPGGAGGHGGSGGAGGSGGGLFDLLGAPSVASTTIAGNAAGAGGGLGPGGMGNASNGAAGNLGLMGTGGGIGVDPSAAVSESDSLLASNAPVNCTGIVADSGHDLSFPDTTCPHAVSGDPKLGPLASYGGPTQTLALGAGSAAINQLPATGAGCPSTDQRGVVRPQPAGGACDIGAYEVAPPTCRPIGVATRGSRPVIVQLSCGDPAGLEVQYAIVHGPAHGRLGTLNRGAGRVTYTASSGFVGSDRFTYKGINLNGSSSVQTVAITVTRGPLVISNARLSKRRFRVDAGTKFLFMLSLAAQVKATITHVRHGRTVTVGSVSAHKPVGNDSLSFSGRISGAALAPGSYKATLVASVGGRRSKPVTLSFVILR